MALDEKKLNKFEELASKRVSNAIHAVRLIGNLSNRNNYAYTKEHVKQIVDSLQASVDDVNNRFQTELKSESSHVFSFVHTQEMQDEAAAGEDTSSEEEDDAEEVTDSPSV